MHYTFIQKKIESDIQFKRNTMNSQKKVMDIHKTIYTDYNVELSLQSAKDLYNKNMNRVDVSEYEKEIENQIPIIVKQHV